MNVDLSWLLKSFFTNSPSVTQHGSSSNQSSCYLMESWNKRPAAKSWPISHCWKYNLMPDICSGFRYFIGCFFCQMWGWKLNMKKVSFLSCNRQYLSIHQFTQPDSISPVYLKVTSKSSPIIWCLTFSNVWSPRWFPVWQCRETLDKRQEGDTGHICKKQKRSPD